MEKLNHSTSAKIQILRGLAIIAVVFIHNTPTGLPQVFVRPFLNFSVGLFLFLSGFLSSADRWNPKKRIVKVAIPYVVWTLVYVVMSNIKSPAAIPLQFARCLVMGGAAAMMYYVFVYCEFMLLIPLIDKLARSKYKYLPFAIAPVEIVVMRLLPLVLGYSVNPYIRILMGVSCLGWFTYFYLGYLLGNGLLTVRLNQTKLGVMLAGSVLIQFAEGYWYYSMGEMNCGTQLKRSVILTGAVFMLVVYNYLKSETTCTAKWLTNLGNLSFGIYFSHIAIMWMLAKLPMYSQIPFPINAIIVVFASYICVWRGRKIFGKYSKYMAL